MLFNREVHKIFNRAN